MFTSISGNTVSVTTSNTKKCRVCGRRCARIQTFEYTIDLFTPQEQTPKTIEARLIELAREWKKSPNIHEKCELYIKITNAN